jgi:hypothetical protein
MDSELAARREFGERFSADACK